MLEERGQPRQTFLEGLIILTFRLCPLHLGQCRHAGQSLIFYHTLRRHILRPEVGLSAQDMLTCCHRERVGCRIQGIYSLDRDKTTTAAGLKLRVFHLLVVEIAMCGRGHHHVVAGLGSLRPWGTASPRHNHRVLRTTVQNLVPPQGTTPF